MSAHGFRSLYMAAGVAGAALGCYLVSLNVASERSKLEAVEAEIAMTQRDIRVLQTETGTRGRLAQLERWNTNFIRLSAPSADQFLEGGFQLATMVRPKDKPVIEAPVVLASATVNSERTPTTAPRDGGTAPADMMHTVSYTKPDPATVRIDPVKTAAPVKNTEKGAGKPSTTNGAKTALADPLSPLPVRKPSATAATPGKAAAKPQASTKPKDTGTPQ
jgi:hypothetical protein